jgi:outer membrane protein assembly factor BamB
MSTQTNRRRSAPRSADFLSLRESGFTDLTLTFLTHLTGRVRPRKGWGRLVPKISVQLEGTTAKIGVMLWGRAVPTPFLDAPCLTARLRLCRAALLGFLVAVSGLRLYASDWPQYRGPNHDGISTDLIRTNWSDVPPHQVWKIPIDPALSSLTISGGKVFTQVRRTINGQEQELCVALNADTGQELWATPLGIASYPNGGIGPDDGPRSTPSVDGNEVFVTTSYLRVVSLHVSDGHIIWSKDLVALYGAQIIDWQNGASPLLEGGVLFLNCNGTNATLLALRESDGSEVWKGQTDALIHATPIAATLAGVRQIVFFTQSGLISVAPADGSVFWRYAFPFAIATGASPIAANDIVYCSAAYGVGAGAVQVTPTNSQVAANQLWRTPGANMNHWATPVQYNGYLYGIYGQDFSMSLRCVQFATGTEKWRQTGFSSGAVLFTTGLALVLNEDGYLVLVQPNPTGYSEVVRYQALDGSLSSIPGLPVKCWNLLAISNSRIYVRSTTEAVCLDVSPPPPLKLTASLSGGRTLRLLIGTADNSPLDSSRATNISVLASSSLTTTLSNWLTLTNQLFLTNGQLLLEDIQTGTAGQKFFRAKEGQ